MKFEITQLKAPWPKGARVGDVIELPGIPSWAVGKCRQVDDDTAATVEFGEGDRPARPDGDRLNEFVDLADKAMAEQRQRFMADMQELRTQLDAEVEKNATLQQRFDRLAAEFDDQRVKLTAADGAAQAARVEADDLRAKLEKAEASLAEAKTASAKPKKG